MNTGRDSQKQIKQWWKSKYHLPSQTNIMASSACDFPSLALGARLSASFLSIIVCRPSNASVGKLGASDACTRQWAKRGIRYCQWKNTLLYMRVVFLSYRLISASRIYTAFGERILEIYTFYHSISSNFTYIQFIARLSIYVLYVYTNEFLLPVLLLSECLPSISIMLYIYTITSPLASLFSFWFPHGTVPVTAAPSLWWPRSTHPDRHRDFSCDGGKGYYMLLYIDIILLIWCWLIICKGCKMETYTSWLSNKLLMCVAFFASHAFFAPLILVLGSKRIICETKNVKLYNWSHGGENFFFIYAGKERRPLVFITHLLLTKPFFFNLNLVFAGLSNYDLQLRHKLILHI